MVSEDAATRNHALIRRFYEAFDDGDGDTMANCYAPDAIFRDPVFGVLQGKEIGSMWRMLASRATRLDVDLIAHDADATEGWAQWEASYDFTETGRPVINRVRARFRFADGLIVEHVDDFSFFGWARQALGPSAFAIGWSPPGRNLVRRRARAQLRRFDARSSSSE